jgi:hypothetical protein
MQSVSTMQVSRLRPAPAETSRLATSAAVPLAASLVTISCVRPCEPSGGDTSRATHRGELRLRKELAR